MCCVVFSMVVFTISVSLAIYLHPGFSLFDPNSSLSKMGALKDPHAWVFDWGIILTGFFLIMFSLGMSSLYWKESHKFYSTFLFLIASFFYVGFGIFPYGTPYHTPLAESFFLLASISIFLWSFAAIIEKEVLSGILLILMDLSAYGVYFFYQILGFPFAELYGGIVVAVWSVYAGFVDARKYFEKKYGEVPKVAKILLPPTA